MHLERMENIQHSYSCFTGHKSVSGGQAGTHHFRDPEPPFPVALSLSTFTITFFQGFFLITLCQFLSQEHQHSPPKGSKTLTLKAELAVKNKICVSMENCTLSVYSISFWVIRLWPFIYLSYLSLFVSQTCNFYFFQ